MNLIPAFLTILLAQAGSGPSEARPPRQLSGHSAPVYDVSISPDARLVATASEPAGASSHAEAAGPLDPTDEVGRDWICVTLLQQDEKRAIVLYKF